MLAFAAAASIVLMLVSGPSSVLASTSSDSQPAGNSPLPQFLQVWQNANLDYSGCVTGSVQQQTVEEVPCQFNLPAMGSLMPTSTPAAGKQQVMNPLYSYGPNYIYCVPTSPSCFAGGEFYYNGPYAQLTGYVTIPSAPSSTPGKFGGWIALTNCNWSYCPASGSIAVGVQSGFGYGSNFNGSSPDMFVELVGNFNWNGHNCASTSVFCGYRIQEQANDVLYNAEFYNSNGWTAYVQDNTQSTYTLVTDSGSNVGVTGSLPYVLVSMEADGASGNTYITTPIDFTSLYVSYPIGTQVSIDSSHMLGYVGPGGFPAVTVSYSATGTTTADVTIS
jgi:hypothetical protein